MKTTTTLMLGTLAAALVASPILARQQAERRAPVAPECRAEIVKLCGEDRTQRRACLMEKRAQLSDGCKTELRQLAEQRRAQRGTNTPAPAPTASPAPEL